MITEHIGQHEGLDIHRHTLTNIHGLSAQISEFGATLEAVFTPDRHGKLGDILLGYDHLEQWLENPPYFGAMCGRVANRIANGRFSIDGNEYQLEINNSPNGYPCALHGGNVGFSHKVWKGTPFRRDGATGVTLYLTSPDGDQAYPGTLDISVTYTLTDNNELVINTKATTDAPTIVNIVNHAYWNLSAHQGSSALDHVLEIPSDFYLPGGEDLIPTGEKKSVSGTPFDFRSPKTVGQHIEEIDDDLLLGNGYDHCFVLASPSEENDIVLAAKLTHPESGRTLELYTNQPGVQLYTANFLEGHGKNSATYEPRHAICLESEQFPDAINQPNFPSPILRPGDIYRHKVVHKFGLAT